MGTRRTVVGAHYGLRDWLAQRVTACVLTVYTVVLLVALLSLPELDYAAWAGLFATSWMKVLTVLALVALFYHVWVGVRDIFMDYVKPTALRLFLQVATIVALLGYAIWSLMILWRV
ncbi:MAG: succinate dehydrogenase, hydrophobic membrane anchor protein [Burkholderiales bacterium]|nr:MAG: succinate dehydrogenase, hydrophobic membrane anchor protein [Burkholderiales bacterium]